ncbi:MAG: hypothetical protein ISR44_08060 [Rhodospirillales bacterium]|nr:hypothetical protein [Alphaproteobacteria bacterium]MBL6929115.1 hypothetical protein [Rhodospirillales bacterium]
MSDQASTKDGTRASTEIQLLIVKLLAEGIDPKAIAIATCGVGSAMLTKQFSQPDATQIGYGLVESAARGDLPLIPALTATNANPKE